MDKDRVLFVDGKPVKVIFETELEKEASSDSVTFTFSVTVDNLNWLSLTTLFRKRWYMWLSRNPFTIHRWDDN